jgi:hypothetical protein
VEEEEKLRKIMEASDGKSWKDIAVHFPLRSPDAVRNKFKKMSDTEKLHYPHHTPVTPIQSSAPKVKKVPTVTSPSPPQQQVTKSSSFPKKVEEPPVLNISSPHSSSLETKQVEEDRRRKLWTPGLYFL